MFDTAASDIYVIVTFFVALLISCNLISHFSVGICDSHDLLKCIKRQPSNQCDGELQVVSGSPFTRQLMLKGSKKAGNGTITVCH